MIIESTHFYKPSLEEEFEGVALQDRVNIHEECDFPDYLEPNEYFPEGVQPHLQKSKAGILVSTGTERSFFDLTFSDEAKCEGLVVIDVNPRVKAYVDFNVLMLRISKTRDTYAKLSTIPKDDQSFQKRIKSIEKKTNKSAIPGAIKEYYLKNLKPFASIYLTSDHFWRGSKSEYFTKCRYDLIDDQFLKLQRYARSGNIIATVGDINDLTFLKNRTISIVDTSNILNYCMLNPQGAGNFCPRIIWTQITMERNTYRSYVHENLNLSDNFEFNSYWNEINKKHSNVKVIAYIFNSMIARYNDNSENEQFDACTGFIYSKKTLIRLKEFLDEERVSKKRKIGITSGITRS